MNKPPTVRSSGALEDKPRPGPPAVAGRSVALNPGTPSVVCCAYVDQVRAEQAAQALRIWARAQRGLRAAPVAVVARKLSGGSTYEPLRIVRPRRGLIVGLLIGLVFFGLPAAGAAGLAGWAFGSIVFGLFGLIGVVSGNQVGTMVVGLSLVLAFLAVIIVGGFGVVIGAAIGALVGVIDSLARGFSGSERTRFSSGLAPGAAAVVTRTSVAAAGLVEQELARLGGRPMVLADTSIPREPTDAGTKIAPTA
jgi:hypothetical protein